MTEREYREHPAVSRSDLWRFHESPEKFKFSLENPDEPSPALLFGQVFHKLALEPDNFSDEFAVAPDVDRRFKEGKGAWADFTAQAADKTVITQDVMDAATDMVKSLMSVQFVPKLLSGERETPYFWTDRTTGEPCKCRVDCLCTALKQPVIVDLKSTNDASTEAFTRDAIKYGYDLQAAMYSRGVEACTGVKPLFAFIVVEKSPPYAVNVFLADDLFVTRGEMLFREFLAEYHYCKQSGNWYGYMGRDNQINNLALPVWLAKELI